MATKGPAVSLPLNGNASVYGPDITSGQGLLWQARSSISGTVNTGNALVNPGSTGTNRYLASGNLAGTSESGFAFSIATKAQYDANPTYKTAYADLSGVSAATINQLRQAFQIQNSMSVTPVAEQDTLKSSVHTLV